MKTTPPARRVNLTALAFAAAMAATASMAWADAGAPLPLCSQSGLPFYAVSYFNPTSGAAPTVTLSQVTIAGATTTVAPTWTGQSATSPYYPSPDAAASGASVAAGMGKDGYIYAIRAVDGDLWDLSVANAWRADFRRYQLLRYGAAGVTNLGIVDGLGTYRTDPNNSATQINGVVDIRLGPNFNAADINPVDGYLYAAVFQTGGKLNEIYKIDVTTTPPKYVGTLTLSSSIPGNKSGDFAIDAAGKFAYGVAGSLLSAASYKIDLSTGAVSTLSTSPGLVLGTGGAARLADGTFALYGPGVVQILDPDTGMITATMSGPSSDSADATACLTAIQPANPSAIPTLDLLGLSSLAGLLGGLGLLRQRRKRR